MIIAILIGRKESKGFPGKNIYKILGKPLAYYPMKAANNCPEIDRRYISTDDEELMRIAKENNIEVIQRPPELRTDEALGEDVYIYVYNYIKNRVKKQEIELVILLMCNAATITSQTISAGIKILRENPDYDSAVSVSGYNMWSPLRARRINKDGLLEPFIPFEIFGDLKRLNCDRDSQGDVWFADMGVSVVRPKCLENIKEGLLPQRWMGRRIYPLKQWGGLDVDFKWQIGQVEYWIREQGAVEKK
ncbi:MAG: cytidylyltransferase [Candidatus Omnitrophota bacterium]|nr:cytidylyltransferase [Candidatus Omnitrophota bacterium]